jgi:hypothetical protein
MMIRSELQKKSTLVIEEVNDPNEIARAERALSRECRLAAIALERRVTASAGQIPRRRESRGIHSRDATSGMAMGRGKPPKR